MQRILDESEEVGARLRAERDRLGFNQTDLAQIGGVSRNSQTAYETGKTPFTSEYLRVVAKAGVDPLFVLTGERTSGVLTDKQTGILAAFEALVPHHRDAVLQLARSLSGMPAPTPDPAVALPNTHALEQMFEALLAAIDPGWSRAEQALLLAQRLPIGLSHLQHLAPESSEPPVRQQAPATAGANRAMHDPAPTS